jgi:hypothetical protein
VREATSGLLPFSTRTSVDASLHMLWGGRQSSCFTSAMVVQLSGASTTNARVPSPRELRTVTLIASGATTGRALATDIRNGQASQRVACTFSSESFQPSPASWVCQCGRACNAAPPLSHDCCCCGVGGGKVTQTGLLLAAGARGPRLTERGVPSQNIGSKLVQKAAAGPLKPH